MPSMRSPDQYLAVLRQMGPRWLLFRAGQAFLRRAGFLRRASPILTWDKLPAPTLTLQMRASGPLMLSAWSSACVKEAEAILQGTFRLFSSQAVSAGVFPNWHHNQLTTPRVAGRHPRGDLSRPLDARHWSDISDARGGDIKGVWELSRFSWAYTLVRAHARTRDWRFADAFWRLFTDWCRQNPPNAGPNWMCGQETTFRLMAVVFAAESLGVPEEQRTLLARFVLASGRRIAAHLDYALSQDNNHGISECVGLITAGLLLPAEKEAYQWQARGMHELENQLATLVYDDGGFSQHSLIYHRVLLHDLCWGRWRFDLYRQRSPAWLDSAARRAVAHLMAMTDLNTGLAPLYGSNDGANVLPLADAGFLDMRPVIQLTSALFQDELSEPPGSWDEAAAWMKPNWNSLPRTRRVTPAVWHAPNSGYFQLQSGQARLFLRCPTRFLHRPAQADMLHVDVWHNGQPVAMDGGSFSYNSKERYTELNAAAHHNVLTVDRQEPIKKFSRFLYLPWPRGTAADAGHGVFRCSHNGYAKLGITWVREVSTTATGGFIVRDLIRGAGEHRLRWHWRLADAVWCEDGRDAVRAHVADVDYKISWSGALTGHSRLIRADKSSAYGWWAPHYSVASSAVALVLEMDATHDIEFTVEFRPLR